MDILAEIQAPELPEESREQTQASIRKVFEDREFAHGVQTNGLFLFSIGWEGIEDPRFE